MRAYLYPQLLSNVGVANGTSKILSLVNFSCDLEISTAFAKSLEVSFIVHLSRLFGHGLGFSSKGLGVSASLGFYHLPPLNVCVNAGIRTCLSPRLQFSSPR